MTEEYIKGYIRLRLENEKLRRYLHEADTEVERLRAAFLKLSQFHLTQNVPAFRKIIGEAIGIEKAPPAEASGAS